MESSALSHQDGAGGRGFVLDEPTKDLLRRLVIEGYPAAGEGKGPQVDWDAIWSMAESGPSEELVLGLAVLAAEEAVAGDPFPAPSALVAGAWRSDGASTKARWPAGGGPSRGAVREVSARPAPVPVVGFETRGRPVPLPSAGSETSSSLAATTRCPRGPGPPGLGPDGGVGGTTGARVAGATA